MNAIEIKDLTKLYSGFTLDHLNLVLPEGCIMGLVGENGAGKSTTIKLILDMIHKDGSLCSERITLKISILQKKKSGSFWTTSGFPNASRQSRSVVR